MSRRAPSSKVRLALLQAVGLDLLRNQVLGGDIDLLVLGVARQADDFHPIQQGRRDVHRVRGAEEHHVGQVVVDFQVVIVEVVVLLRVEHLEQRRGGIPAHVAAHLVDFVEEEQRVAHADLGHLLDQAARHGADIGTTVTADLGLVTHAAERHAHELAIGGASDGFGQEVLPTPGGPTRQRTGPLSFFTRFCTARYSRMRSLTSSRP